ncbi:hydrogenase maturation nickel metallochaperone HypA [Oleidesulfovibrio sp.]|uniref:hydrogenase maturation nickel metallochaperone HypA/HybF n=1 Tax=Oleidesulfovibrio sp. TaxID=2909707 RepID=UPI003A8879B3
MHEMSIAASLIGIVKEEMAKHGATRLLMVRVRYGRLTNIVPEALQMGFEATSMEAGLQGARLELVEVPLTVACGGCGNEFTPEHDDIVYMPCPKCGREFAHEVLTGRELFVDHIEAE